MSAGENTKKQVLIFVQGHSRPMELAEDKEDINSIKEGIRELFSDVFQQYPIADFFLQVKDAKWGYFLDLCVGQTVHDGDVLQVQIDQKSPDMDTTTRRTQPNVVVNTDTADTEQMTQTHPSDQMQLLLTPTSLRLSRPSAVTPQITSPRIVKSVHSEEYIKKQAVIFGRDKGKSASLTPYHMKMNEASIELCLQNPELLSDRTKLMEKAREKVHDDGYAYKKGASRSKRLRPESDNQNTPKRSKTSQDMRLSRIAELEEDIKDVTDQITIKEKRREIASNNHQYKDCDRLTTQISALRQKLREHRSELKQFQKRQRKSKSYKTNKSSSDQSSLPSPVSSNASLSVSPSPIPSCSSEQIRSPPPPMSPPPRRKLSCSSLSPQSSLAQPMIFSSESEVEGSTSKYSSDHDTVILSSEHESGDEQYSQECNPPESKPQEVEGNTHFQ